MTHERAQSQPDPAGQAPARLSRVRLLPGPTDLLDGTITLPLIEAAKVDLGIREVDLHSLGPGSATALCDRIGATGALDRVRTRALEMVAAAKRELAAADFAAEQRQLLGLVADGVVQRYS